MSKYMDGFVIPVRRDKLDAYREMAELGSKVWKEHGALEYRESVSEDVKPGKLTSFPQSVILQEDEVVIFAYIVFESREHRDKVNALAMNDPRFAAMDPSNMPFDTQRMIYGGFQVLVES
jgi:uncharacterized protein YbaA (DUF1428 family)